MFRDRPGQASALYCHGSVPDFLLPVNFPDCLLPGQEAVCGNFQFPLQVGLAMGGPETLECEDEALYGREYLDWKKQTLGTQVGAAAAEIGPKLVKC